MQTPTHRPIQGLAAFRLRRDAHAYITLYLPTLTLYALPVKVRGLENGRAVHFWAILTPTAALHYDGHFYPRL